MKLRISKRMKTRNWSNQNKERKESEEIKKIKKIKKRFERGVTLKFTMKMTAVKQTAPAFQKESDTPGTGEERAGR